MSFMMKIDEARAAQHPPIEHLAADFFQIRSKLPSIEFCRQAVGVPDTDAALARRLNVAVETVRGWRDIGRRASGQACR
jgi:DNA-binding transcriptional regulator YiaG